MESSGGRIAGFLNAIASFARTGVAGDISVPHLDPAAVTPPVSVSAPRKLVSQFIEKHWSDLLMLGLSLSATFLAMRFIQRFMDPHKKDKDKAKEQSDEVLRNLAGRMKRPIEFELNQYEQMVASDIVFPEKINVALDDIGGLESVKQRLFETLILPLQQPHLFQRGKLLSAPKGILLYGPPGTGKTMLAKAVARTSEAAFINLNFSTLTQKWYGESEKMVQAVFSLADKVEPCIIFIDEIDCMFRRRQDDDHEVTTRVKAAFMTHWDGLMTNPESRITIIGATNRPNSLDEAVQRRMPQTFHVGLPDFTQRVAILRILLKGEPLEPGFNIERLAGETEGYSGSDLHALSQAAAMYPVRDYIQLNRGSLNAAVQPDAAQLRPMRLNDFMQAKSVVGSTGASARAYEAQSQPAPQQVPASAANAFMAMMAALSSSFADASNAPEQ